MSFDDFADHHQLKRHEQVPLDPSIQAPKEIKDTAWAIIQGRGPTQQDDPGTITVPREYVSAVAWHAARELKRRGCTAQFSVRAHADLPQVQVAWQRASGLVTADGNAYQGTTDCLSAFAQGRDPQHVGIEAVDVFLTSLGEAQSE
jgi:hypothetical protein